MIPYIAVKVELDMQIKELPIWLRFSIATYVFLFSIFIGAFLNMKEYWGFHSFSPPQSILESLVLNPLSLIAFALSTLNHISVGSLFFSAVLFVPLMLVYLGFIALLNFLGLIKEAQSSKSSKPSSLAEFFALGFAVMTIHSFSAGLDYSKLCAANKNISTVYNLARQRNTAYERHRIFVGNQKWDKTLDTPGCDPALSVAVLKSNYSAKQMELFNEYYFSYQDRVY